MFEAFIVGTIFGMAWYYWTGGDRVYIRARMNTPIVKRPKKPDSVSPLY